MAKRPSKIKPPEDQLLPLSGAPRRTRVVTYDVESKDGASEMKGFSRAFLVGFYDGEDYFPFRNVRPHLDVNGYSLDLRKEDQQYKELIKLDPERRAIAEGGCVDRFLRFLMGDVRRPHTIVDTYGSRKATIYAHNGGRFDGTFILAWLRAHADEFDVRITCVASRAQKIVVTRKVTSMHPWRRLHRKMPSWTFIDSALILPMTLDQAGKTFCANDPEIRKLAEFDLDTHENDARWEEYNRMDCLVLHRAISELRDLVEGLGGELGITAPATSMKTFRRAFLHEPVERNRHFPACRARSKQCRDLDDACLHTWIRRGYHGGRTEVFTMTAPPGSRYYDLNSSYPASMKHDMPVGDATEVSPADFFDLLPKLQESQIGFVECEVSIPETCIIPPLPYPSDDGKLRFPTGTFSGVWAWDELRLIFDPMVNGKITKVIRSVWFRKRPIFREFVDKLYSYRTYAKEHPSDLAAQALSELCKLILNGHYGKYGMHPEREELVTIKGGHDPMPGDRGSLYPKVGTPLDGDHINGDVWVIKTRVDAPYMIPQIASYITALSRIALWQANVAGVKLGGMPAYNDTDSNLMASPYRMLRCWSCGGIGALSSGYEMTDCMICNATGNLPNPEMEAWFDRFEKELGIGNALGQWKREFPTWVLSAQFLLPKSYLLKNELSSMDRVVKLKGIGRKARTEENFHALARGETVYYHRIEQHRTILKEGRHAPREIKVSKRIIGTYDKRSPQGDSGMTKAIHIVPEDHHLHAHVMDADRESEYYP